MNSPSVRTMMLEALLILLLAALVGIGINGKTLINAWSGRAVSQAPAAAPAVAIPLPLGLMQVKELFDNREAVVIDSRDSRTFAAGHIRDAVSLPLENAAKLVPEFSGRVPKSTMLVIYCNGYACEDSVELGKQLIAAGYATVYYFDGGFPAWRDAGYPVSGGGQ